MCYPSPVTVSKPASQQRTPDFVLVSLTRCSFKGIVRLKRGRQDAALFHELRCSSRPTLLTSPAGIWMRQMRRMKEDEPGWNTCGCVCVQGVTYYCYRSVSNKQYSNFSNVPTIFRFSYSTFGQWSPHLSTQNNRWNLLFKPFYVHVSIWIIENEWIAYYIC